MCSPGINGEGELRRQPVNPGSTGKLAVKTVCVCGTVRYNSSWPYPAMAEILSKTPVSAS